MGWAERRKRRMGARPLRWRECERVAEGIKAAAVIFNLDLNGTDLGDMAKAAEWLASFKKDPFEPGGADSADRKRTMETFPLMEQARRMASALAWATQADNAGDVVSWVRGRINRLSSQEEEAQDHLLELEIGAKLARWQGNEGLRVSFEEPDIVLSDGKSLRMGIACKRPRSISGVQNLVRKGRKQLRGEEVGVIVVGTEAILHRNPDQNDEHRRTVLYQVDTPTEAVAEGYRLVDEAIEASRREWSRGFAEGVDGVLFCGVMTYWSQNPSMYGYSWIRRAEPNPQKEGASEALAGLQMLLFDSPSIPADHRQERFDCTLKTGFPESVPLEFLKR